MPVKVRKLQETGARFDDTRRGRRMNSRVPIRLEWEAEDGKRQEMEAITRTVNVYGCMVFLCGTLELEQRMALTNLATKACTAAVIVWRGNHQPDGWEYGVELVAPDTEFWGIEL